MYMLKSVERELMKKREIVNECCEITAKTVLSAIPVGGTLVTCVWDSIKAHAAQKRIDEWKSLIEERLMSVELELNEVGENELFTSAMMRATDIALKTAEKEKREYLANAVSNSLFCSIDESVLMIYLDLLEKYTAWHLKILHFFKNPVAYEAVNVENVMMGSASTALQQAFPAIMENSELVNKIVSDLQSDGMLEKGSYMNAGMTKQGIVASRTTKLGNDFLDYITG